MVFNGTVSILAPIEKVWDRLTDAEFVAHCAPGVKEMEVVVPNEKYLAVVSIGFGSVVSVFKVNLEFLEMRKAEYAKVSVHGDTPGSAADATCEMVLAVIDDNSTALNWNANIEIVGKIASIASRMMGSLTKKLTSTFFDCVKEQIEA